MTTLDNKSAKTVLQYVNGKLTGRHYIDCASIAPSAGADPIPACNCDQIERDSSNGKTTVSKAENEGSIPSSRANTEWICFCDRVVKDVNAMCECGRTVHSPANFQGALRDEYIKQLEAEHFTMRQGLESIVQLLPSGNSLAAATSIAKQTMESISLHPERR